MPSAPLELPAARGSLRGMAEHADAASRFAFMTHRGKRILRVDYENLAPREVIALARSSQTALLREPLGSGRVLMVVTNARFDVAVAKTLQTIAAENTPYVKGVALVGMAGLQRIIHQAVTKIMQMELPTFPTEADALDWLAGLP